MEPEIALKKARLSRDFLRELEDYYHQVPYYPRLKWRQWANDPDITTYLAEKDGRAVGWIVYRSSNSTIEEILVSGSDGDCGETALEFQLVDALIARENLVAAEIVRCDQEKYHWMVRYGFRPTRRFTDGEFLMLKMDLALQVLFQRLAKLGKTEPVGVYRQREQVVIEKVAATQTDADIKKALASLMEKLGGVEKYVKPGNSVVIKPNIVSDHGLKEGRYKGGIVTDPRLVKALVELLLPAAGRIIIAEGSSINRSATTKMFAHYGYQNIVDLYPKKVRLVDLNRDEVVEKPVPGGKRMLARNIPVTLENADVIISVPVLKIHFAAVVSLAIKNLQGAVPPLEKYMTHFFGLWQNLVNIHHLVKPQLTIIDGLTGQEDFGPISGVPKKMDVLIGGTNPVAVDSVAMRIMGIDPADSPPVKLAWMQGLGPLEPEKIDIIGPPLHEVTNPFKRPEINLKSGRDINVHDGGACTGCRGYLHFVLNKLRRPDPEDTGRLLIDRPLPRKANIFLGPATKADINPEETNIFMGVCQQHHADLGTHLPGCPPHAEVIIDGIYLLFPGVERAKYAEKSEEAALGEMLKQILAIG